MEIQEESKMVGVWNVKIENIETGEVREKTYYNLIPLVGRTAWAAQMASLNTKNIGDNRYIACGSNATPPSSSDTQLGTETTRKAVASDAFTNNVASIAVFFAAGEATGTHREYGLFGDGNTTACSATANSGIIYSHVAANDVVGAVETLTLTFSISYV